MKKYIINVNKGFYVGDLCYALDERVYSEEWGDKYNYEDGQYKDSQTDLEFAMVGTAYGDGEYEYRTWGLSLSPENKIHGFPVDAGIIGIADIDLCTRTEEDGTSHYEGLGMTFNYSGKVAIIYDNGTISVEWSEGNVIEIFTSNEYDYLDEYEDEYNIEREDDKYYDDVDESLTEDNNSEKSYEQILAEKQELIKKINELHDKLHALKETSIKDIQEIKDSWEHCDDKYQSNIAIVNGGPSGYTIGYNAYSRGEYSLMLLERMPGKKATYYTTVVGSKSLEDLKQYAELFYQKEELRKQVEDRQQEFNVAEKTKKTNEIVDNKVFNLDSDEDLEFIEDHIEIPDDLEYENLTAAVIYHPGKMYLSNGDPGYPDEWEETEIDWTYSYNYEPQDLLDYIDKTYDHEFTGKDLKEFDNKAFYDFLLDKYEDKAREDAEENWEPEEYEPDYDDYRDYDFWD